MRAATTLLLGALTILAGCKDLEPIPAEDLGIEVHAPLEPVTPARAFELTLVRRWSKRLGDLANDGAWERAFQPLVVRLAHTERREDAERVEETRVYRAYAMSRGDVVVAPVAWKPVTWKPDTWKPNAAPDLVASTPRLTLRVRPEVDADDPGAPEIPPATLEAPRPPSPWLWALMLVPLVLLVLLARTRARRRAALAPAPPPAPDTTHADLAALAGRAPAELVLGAADLLRQALARRLGFPAACRTREEILAVAGRHARVSEPLARLLTRADAVAYGRHAATHEEAQRSLDDARAALAALPPAGGAS